MSRTSSGWCRVPSRVKARAEARPLRPGRVKLLLVNMWPPRAGGSPSLPRGRPGHTHRAHGLKRAAHPTDVRMSLSRQRALDESCCGAARPAGRGSLCLALPFGGRSLARSPEAPRSTVDRESVQARGGGAHTWIVSPAPVTVSTEESTAASLHRGEPAQGPLIPGRHSADSSREAPECRRHQPKTSGLTLPNPHATVSSSLRVGRRGTRLQLFEWVSQVAGP